MIMRLIATSQFLSLFYLALGLSSNNEPSSHDTGGLAARRHDTATGDAASNHELLQPRQPMFGKITHSENQRPDGNWVKKIYVQGGILVLPEMFGYLIQNDPQQRPPEKVVEEFYQDFKDFLRQSNVAVNLITFTPTFTWRRNRYGRFGYHLEVRSTRLPLSRHSDAYAFRPLHRHIQEMVLGICLTLSGPIFDRAGRQ